MNDEILWNNDDPIRESAPGIAVPAWIDPDVTPSTVAAIVQGGCASGAYMPAVTYYQALETMSEHGDDVFEYIEDALGDIPTPGEAHESWAGMACFYLSCAVELWASSVEEELSDELEADADDDTE